MNEEPDTETLRYCAEKARNTAHTIRGLAKEFVRSQMTQALAEVRAEALEDFANGLENEARARDKANQEEGANG